MRNMCQDGFLLYCYCQNEIKLIQHMKSQEESLHATAGILHDSFGWASSKMKLGRSLLCGWKDLETMLAACPDHLRLMSSLGLCWASPCCSHHVIENNLQTHDICTELLRACYRLYGGHRIIESTRLEKIFKIIMSNLQEEVVLLQATAEIPLHQRTCPAVSALIFADKTLASPCSCLACTREIRRAINLACKGWTDPGA